MRIFHGSEFVIENPEHGKGKSHNDYGRGFYCTESAEMAKEWSCEENHDGYANEYEIELSGLKVLNLNSDEYNILNWLAILLKNRTFRLTNQVAKDAREYLIKNYDIDIDGYDVVIGYRADDSYFSFAQDFINNEISVRKLSEAMTLGNLGEQIVLVSEKAFENITYVGSEHADRARYYALRERRDREAREQYLNSNRKHSYDDDETYIIDIMRRGRK